MPQTAASVVQDAEEGAFARAGNVRVQPVSSFVLGRAWIPRRILRIVALAAMFVAVEHLANKANASVRMARLFVASSVSILRQKLLTAASAERLAKEVKSV